MKYLVFEAFTGVGFCNQLFSIETGIYLASISKRRLVLILKNPLCHCGKAYWEYGNILDYMTDDYFRYLPHGVDIYYKSIPENIQNSINDNKKTLVIKHKERFSQNVFVDENLDTTDNEPHLNEFLHGRTKEYMNLDSEKEFVYIYQSNASRCFYNFYTTQENYQLMFDICQSLKFKNSIYDMANAVLERVQPTKRNKFVISCHLRFGDYSKENGFITRFNKIMKNSLIPFVKAHRTNMINPTLAVITDRKDNKDFFDCLKNVRVVHLDDVTKRCVSEYVEDNKMRLMDMKIPKSKDVLEALVQMVVASQSDEFVGTISSTFTNYIQYLRYNNNRSCCFYANIDQPNTKQCKFLEVNPNSVVPWVKYKYHGGHPIGWHVFWEPPHTRKEPVKLTIHGKTDGFGSQLQAMLSLMAYCRFQGINYVHTPMYQMQHNYDNDTDFVSKMNSFTNFNALAHPETHMNEGVVQRLEGPFVHGTYHPEFFYDEDFRSHIREIYYGSEKPKIHFFDNTEVKHVALHIRRGDVSLQKYPGRFTSNETYIQLVNALLSIATSPYKIHVFSQGNLEDFQDLSENIKGIEYHLNEDIRTTFHSLVSADVLVLSRSSFSYCAALLNANTVVANNIQGWWHKPLSTWLIV